jgi:hypothetical protein
MDNKEVLWSIVNKQTTIAGKKKMAKALGLKFEYPAVRDQIACKGKVVFDFKRGRSLNGREMVLIPPVELQNGRTIPALAVEPHCAREVAFELLRIADDRGW